jgi:hypothetical protein
VAIFILRTVSVLVVLLFHGKKRVTRLVYSFVNASFSLETRWMTSPRML